MMNARPCSSISLLLVSVCLLQLLFFLHIDAVHGKKRRHRPVQKAAKTNRTVAIGTKSQICADDNGIFPQRPQEPQQQQQENELKPWAFKSDDNSFAFDPIEITVSPAVGNGIGRKTISSNTSTEMTTTSAISSTKVMAQKLNDDQQRNMAQQQQRVLERVSEGEEHQREHNAKMIIREPLEVPKLEMATPAATILAQTKTWMPKAEESAEIGRNQLKPCNKFTGDNGDRGGTILKPPTNHSMVNVVLPTDDMPNMGEQPSAAFDNVFGTLPPGFEPSSPAFALPDELGLSNNKLLEFDAPSPTQQPNAVNSINGTGLNANGTGGGLRAPNDETSTIIDGSSTGQSDGTDIPKYWSFTRLPYINRTELVNLAPPLLEIVPSNDDNNTRAREEDSLAADLELKPPHLGQADFFTPTDAVSKGSGGITTAEMPILDIKCQKPSQSDPIEQSVDKVPTVKEADEGTVPPASLLLDTVYTVLPINPAEGVLPVSADLTINSNNNNNKLPVVPTVTTSNGTVAQATEEYLPATNTVIVQQPNLINFDSTAIGNETLASIDQRNKVEEDWQQKKEWENGISPEALNGTSELDEAKAKEENCCTLLRLLKGKTDNVTTEFAAVIDNDGVQAEGFSGIKLRDQQQKSEVLNDNKLEEKLSHGGGGEEQQKKKGEEAANEDKLERGTIKANWHVIPEGGQSGTMPTDWNLNLASTPSAKTTPKGGMEILKVDLREENFQQLQNYAVTLDSSSSSSRTLSTSSTPSLSDNSIEPVALKKNENTFPWTTESPVISKKWTPYVFDCALETDERGESLCQEWAKGGLCDINRATRFLFCRKTCLCIGILNSPNERTNE